MFKDISHRQPYNMPLLFFKTETRVLGKIIFAHSSSFWYWKIRSAPCQKMEEWKRKNVVLADFPPYILLWVLGTQRSHKSWEQFTWNKKRMVDSKKTREGFREYKIITIIWYRARRQQVNGAPVTILSRVKKSYVVGSRPRVIIVMIIIMIEYNVGLYLGWRTGL